METVNWQRVRIDRLSRELAQRELKFHRAQRADIDVRQTKHWKRSNRRRQTTSPGCVRRRIKTETKLKEQKFTGGKGQQVS